MRDDIENFNARGVRPFGVNPASAEKHLEYVNLKGFPFPLLSDHGKKVSTAYGAVKWMGKSMQRAVVVVGRDGKVVFAEEGMPTDDEILASV